MVVGAYHYFTECTFPYDPAVLVVLLLLKGGWLAFERVPEVLDGVDEAGPRRHCEGIG